MTNILNALKLRFKNAAINNLVIKNEIRQANLARSILVSGLAVPIGVVILLYFNRYLTVNTPVEVDWRDKVMFVHLYTTIAFFVLFVASLSIKKYGTKNSYATAVLSHVVFVVFMQWGALCSIYDQAISTSIIGFLLVSVVSATTLLIHPANMFVLLSIIYTLFFFGITKTQTDHNTLIFNQINGLCTVSIAFALSFISWRSNMARFIQSRLLAQSTKELKKANTSKDKFFSILAHDLKGPINSTLALTELLESGGFEDNRTERLKVYRLLQNSLYNSAKLLDNVLLWARSQSDNITFTPVTLNLFDTVESCIDVLKIVATHKNINILNLTDQHTYISADQDMIHTIFRNLLSNAIKFTPNFGKVEVLSEKISDTQKELISISVVDYGMGMDSITLNNLFTIENKITGRGTNNETGTGLGLVLCKDFIEKQGGSIQVQSVKNNGSRFTITLPAAAGAANNQHHDSGTPSLLV
jgi:two-component system sensor histidine kinase/response regulator